MELWIVNQLLGPVVDAEGLGGEALIAGPALETGYLAEGVGAMVAGPGPPEGKLGFQVVDAVPVGTEWRNQLLAPVNFVCFHTLPYGNQISGACAFGDVF